MTDDEIREALARWLWNKSVWENETWEPTDERWGSYRHREVWLSQADELLPVVRRAQAAALRGAAEEHERDGIPTLFVPDRLRARADALDGGGPGTGLSAPLPG